MKQSYRAFSRRSFSLAMLGGCLAPVDPMANCRWEAMSPRAPSLFSLSIPALQSFTIDDISRLLYVQFVVPGSRDLSSIWRYSIDEGKTLTLLDKQFPSARIGHQGVSIEHNSFGTRLWMGAPGPSRDVVRFSYQSGVEPANVERFKLFGDNFSRTAITMSISYDQRWLIALSRIRSSHGHQKKLRVFDFQNLLASGTGDRSSDFVEEWNLPSELGVPIQGLASFDNQVWISYGRSSSKLKKPLVAFDMRGNFLQVVEDMRVGKASTLIFEAATNYEPEGLSASRLFGQGGLSLLTGLSIGGRHKMKHEIFSIGCWAT
jgi:hypothetical protein